MACIQAAENLESPDRRRDQSSGPHWQVSFYALLSSIVGAGFPSTALNFARFGGHDDDRHPSSKPNLQDLS